MDRPVCHIRFEKITFSYTTWMRPSEKGHVDVYKRQEYVLISLYVDDKTPLNEPINVVENGRCV